MYELDALTIILSVAFTWGIGLLPPILIRYVFLKRPIDKWPAIGVCAFFWFFNIVLFTVLGSESKTHGALWLIAFASYWILRREDKAAENFPTQDKSTSNQVSNCHSISNGVNAEPASVERRLLDLKLLYDKALITDAVYQERQKEILNDGRTN